jgi:hypothetical protein
VPSVGRRWKGSRDRVILIASRGGCSIRFLADVFDLSISGVHRILKKAKNSDA